MMRTICFLMSLLMFVAACSADSTPSKEHINQAYQASVMVVTKSGTGSGVAIKNRGWTFIWTDAHVVDDCQKVSTVVDPNTGQPKVVVGYDDVRLVQNINENNRKVGEVVVLAKIIRFGRYNDLALLYPYKFDWPSASITFDFEPGKVGDDIFHIGSFKGAPGVSSFSKCNIAAVGRLRSNFGHNETSGPLVFDQFSGVSQHGSSGGGVYNSESGKCLGLVTEYLDVPSEGSSCYVPFRRMLEFAKRTKCEWAVDVNQPVNPSEVRMQITDGYVALPKDWPTITIEKKEDEKKPVVAPVPVTPNKPSSMDIWGFFNMIIESKRKPEVPPPTVE